jgi:hypothetical protein
MKSVASQSDSGAIAQPIIRNLTGMSRACERAASLPDSSNSSYNGAGMPLKSSSSRRAL